jgi:hypothetical protein
MVAGGEFLGNILDRGQMTAYLNGDPPPVNVRTKRGVRAYAEGKKSVVLKPDTNTATFIHEYGHVLEYNEPDMLRASIAFRDRRTKGDREISMADATGNPNYTADERTKPDKFFNPYVGKQYGNYASEVVSMGLERLYKDPIAFAADDPEYFDFVILQAQGE